MATLEKLRNRAGVLLIVFMGLALLSFILTDLFSNQSSMFSGKQLEIAKIKGKSVNINEYQDLVNELENNQKLNTGKSSIDEVTRNRLMDAAWDMLIKEEIMSEEYQELGIEVSGEELFDLIQGDEPHPIIKQYFVNPETGILNRSALLQFLRSVNDGEASRERETWLAIEEQIFNERKENKYKNLIRKGLYVTGVDAEVAQIENSKKVSFKYVAKKYTSIPDTLVSVSDKDIEEYYKAHKEEYKQEAMREVEYVTFDIRPSSEDDKAAKEWVRELIPEFKEVEDVEQFVTLNSDVAFTPTNYTKDELPQIISSLFDADQSTVIGPYFENGSYKIAKVAAVNMLPDSVKASHILIQPNQQITYEMAQNIADSLTNLIKNGADFAELAIANSTDGSAAEGGDLGWFGEGQMVKPFNDTCFYGKAGEIKQAVTQFGIHIIKIEKQSPKKKKIQVGIVERIVEPSDQTYDKFYQMASEFAGKNRTIEAFQKAAKKNNYYISQAPALKEMDKTIAGLQSPRPMIKWAYEAEAGDVSSVFEFGDKYVVAALANIHNEGYATIKEKKSVIEFAVRKEKKAQQIIKEMDNAVPNASSINEVASALNISVNSASDITFTSTSIPGGGFEPKVIAVATQMEPNRISKPIEGNNAVYVIEVQNIQDADLSAFLINRQKMSLGYTVSSRANMEAYEALKSVANVEDKRSKFY